MPDDAKEAFGNGTRAKRSKAGAASFDVVSQEASHALLPQIEAACRRPSCVVPDICTNLNTSHDEPIQLYRKVREVSRASRSAARLQHLRPRSRAKRLGCGAYIIDDQVASMGNQ